MSAGWQAAPRNAMLATFSGRRGCQRRPIVEPAIVPTPKLETITAHDPAPPSSWSASTAPSPSTHGSAIQW